MGQARVGNSHPGLFSLLLVVTLSFLHTASATPTEGIFQTPHLQVPNGTSLDVTPLAIYVSDAAFLEQFEAVLPSATLIFIERRFVEIGGPLQHPVQVEQPAMRREWEIPVDGGALSIAGEAGRAGQTRFIGFYPGEASVQLTAQGRLDLVPGSATKLGNRNASAHSDPKVSISYYHEEQRPHVYAKAACDVAFQGTGIIKFSGIILRLEQGGRIAYYETGEKSISPTEISVTTLLLRLDEAATIELSTGAASFEVIAPEASAAGTGVLAFSDARGELSSPEGTYLVGKVRNEPMLLKGVFNLGARPDEGGASLRVQVSGDLQPAGMVFHPMPTVSTPGVPLWGIPFLLGIAFVLAAGVGIAVMAPLHKRVPAKTDLNAMDLDAELAYDAAMDRAQNLEFEAALQWLQVTREKVPTSSKAAMDYAWCLAELGRMSEAIAAYEEAFRLKRASESLEASDLADAGSLLLGRGETTQSIRWLMEAIDLEPDLVFLIEDDYPELKENPVWDDAASRARKRSERGFDPRA